MRILLFLLLFSFYSFSQSKLQFSRYPGEVFKHRPDTPMEDLNQSGEIVVTRTLGRLIFEDEKIHKAYKKMTEKFFQEVFYQRYKVMGAKYRLKVTKNVWGDIYIENLKVGNLKEVTHPSKF